MKIDHKNWNLPDFLNQLIELSHFFSVSVSKVLIDGIIHIWSTASNSDLSNENLECAPNKLQTSRQNSIQTVHCRCTLRDDLFTKETAQHVFFIYIFQFAFVSLSALARFLKKKLSRKCLNWFILHSGNTCFVRRIIFIFIFMILCILIVNSKYSAPWKTIGTRYQGSRARTCASDNY